MEIFVVICLFIVIAALSMAPLFPLWIDLLHNKSKKVYVVVWRYYAFCHPTTELIKAKDAYSAWRKIKRQHGISIDLIEVREYVS